MTRQEIIEECARALDQRAQEQFSLYETLRAVNLNAASNYNLAAREALQCAATIRALVHSAPNAVNEVRIPGFR